MKKGKKVLTKAEIIARCKTLPTTEIEIPGWSASVEMKNVSFSKLLELKKVSGADNELYAALLVGEICSLSTDDVMQMQQGSGAAFMTLFGAANEYLNGRFGDEAVKKQ